MTSETQLGLILASVAIAASPLLLAALGELVAERSGILNLGVEGMMAMGAVTAFVAAKSGAPLPVAMCAGACIGVIISIGFAVLVLQLHANQVAAGLATTLFGTGLSAFVGRQYSGQAIQGLGSAYIPGLSDLPFIGSLIFQLPWFVYGSLAAAVVVAYVLGRTHFGLVVRAVGEAPTAAHSIGIQVKRTRYACVAFGGALSGVAGSCLSLGITPMWNEGLAAGRGWIAVALVVFATWRPLRVVAGAYLFGLSGVLELQAQALGVRIPAEFLSMTPYLATIFVLVIICRDKQKILISKPRSLGR